MSDAAFTVCSVSAPEPMGWQVCPTHHQQTGRIIMATPGLTPTVGTGGGPVFLPVHPTWRGKLSSGDRWKQSADVPMPVRLAWRRPKDTWGWCSKGKHDVVSSSEDLLEAARAYQRGEPKRKLSGHSGVRPFAKMTHV